MTAKINIVICVRGVWSSNLAANQLSRLMLFVILLSLSGQIHFRCVIWVPVNSVTKVAVLDVVPGVGVSCSFLYSSSCSSVVFWARSCCSYESIFLFPVYVTFLSTTSAVLGRMIGWIVNDLDGIWNESNVILTVNDFTPRNRGERRGRSD
jgi:hypothetical protein